MEALVVFTKENSHWLSGLLQPEFRHVYCVVPSPNGAGHTEVNLTCDGVKVISWGASLDELIPAYYDLPDTTVILRAGISPDERSLMPAILNNCVGLTKQLIGIRSMSFTPYQLYKDLHTEADICVSI